MALFENFPYTNLHELNLDWLIQEMKELEQKVQDGPVVSVNGLTGVVTLYRESNIQFPDITDSTVTKWEMFRYLNGSIYGIQFDNNGNVYALRDFARTKLLTWDDIPPEAGVISINDLYGVVHLSGTDIPYMGGETETVYDKLSDLDDDITSAQADINELSVTLTTVDNAIKRGIAYLESTDTAVNNITAGKYVFWKNGAYISTSAISVGDPLSSTNLSAVATGGFINALQNELQTQINTLNSNITTTLGGLKFKRIQINGTTTSSGQLEIDNTTGATVVFLLRNTYDDNVSSSFGVINIENVTATKIMLRFRTLKDGSVNAGASINISIVVAYI